ncbi:MAG: SpvB/TcaC N-terminal domain-containing protein, partial [Bacteroidales bacterium]
SYPLDIPAGRQGMQPQLALSYSSGGGNGWLGVGWDISLPAITVETRWGVPRYDHSKESEVYVLNGEQLVTKDANGHHRPMPHRTNNWQARMNGHIQFYPRVEEAFDSIVRHGSNPTNYWWSVTDRNGVTNYYGKKKGEDALDGTAVLRDAAGNIAHWALTERVDPYGNWVRYEYELVTSYNSSSAIGNAGKQIYLSRIHYTGQDTSAGKYQVLFNRRSTPRQDVIISGRYGFKEVTAATLCHIEVRYEQTAIRNFLFKTENSRNSQYKTRLISLIRIDSPAQAGVDCESSNPYEGSWEKFDAARYDFAYYDYPAGDGLFSAPVAQSNLVSENLHSSFTSSDFSLGNATALGATKGKSWSGGGTASVGLGPNVCMTSVSLGGNFDYSRSESEGLLTLIDLNGDGLSDKVFKEGERVYYRPQVRLDEHHFRFGEKKLLAGVSDFLKESSKTTTWGLQASAGLTGSGGWPSTTSTTSNYFTDINGDGLPDLVTERGAMFNSLNGMGDPVFSYFNTIATSPAEAPQASQTYVATSAMAPCGGIIFDGEVSDSINCERIYIPLPRFKRELTTTIINTMLAQGFFIIGETDSTIIFAHRGESYLDCEPEAVDPDMDAVKVWVAPYAGTINIESVIQLLEDTSQSRQQSHYANGVRYAIQHNRGNTLNPGTYTLSSYNVAELTSGIIAEEDYQIHPNNLYNIVVSPHDLIFFRLQ